MAEEVTEDKVLTQMRGTDFESPKLIEYQMQCYVPGVALLLRKMRDRDKRIYGSSGPLILTYEAMGNKRGCLKKGVSH